MEDMMKKKTIGILVVLVLILVIAIPVSAITFGEQDNGRHPYVGLIGFYDEDWNWMWRCSGTLIADQVVLTAGHCTGEDEELGAPANARVWFDEEIIYDPDLDDYTNEVFYNGVPVPHPEYAWTIPETHDIGVVILDESMAGVIDERGALPTAGLLDEIPRNEKRGTILTSVGYGVNDMHPEEISLRTRYLAQSFLINLNNSLTDGWNIQSSNNNGNWPASPGAGDEDVVSGGTCFGDSGGPVFLGYSDSNLIVGVTSFGNSACAGSDYSYRVDRQDSLDFLAEVAEEYGVSLP
jgi:hypothetical protein